MPISCSNTLNTLDGYNKNKNVSFESLAVIQNRKRKKVLSAHDPTRRVLHEKLTHGTMMLKANDKLRNSTFITNPMTQKCVIGAQIAKSSVPL